MGTKMAPPYANLFLGKLEEEHILNDTYKNNLKFYKRFLDDIFLIWKGKLSKFKLFLNDINNLHPTINFTCQYSTKEINFLDTTIFIDVMKNNFMSKLFTKPTDTGTLLHYTSHHPKHTFENTIYSQTLRYRMLTTNDKILTEQLKNLKNILITRGYPKKLINITLNKIKNTSQKVCLYGKPTHPKPIMKIKKVHFKLKKSKLQKTKKPNTKNNKTLPFIIPFYKKLTPLKYILYKNWNLIENDADLKDILINKPFIVYKRHKNLKDFLVKTRFSSEP